MLRVAGLSKKFIVHVRNGLVIDGIQDISFTAMRGKLLAITGASGIGKSTLLKCIYRTYKPTGGIVWYTSAAGNTINLANAEEQEILDLRRNEIGYVSQFLQVIPRVAALDILTSALTRVEDSNKMAKEKAQYLLEQVGIHKNLWSMYPSTFSGGEKQRLNILLALAGKPRLLLLDEPTASLDFKSKEIIMELINDTKKKGTTMVGVFHDKDAIKSLADNRFDIEKNQSTAVS
ncbi:MAG: ATP-binding cassette domain-containing protein [Thermotaleaceae bacterium]